MGLFFLGIKSHHVTSRAIPAADCIGLGLASKNQPAKTARRSLPANSAIAPFVCSGQIVDKVTTAASDGIYIENLKVKLGHVKMFGLCPFALRTGGVPPAEGPLLSPAKPGAL